MTNGEAGEAEVIARWLSLEGAELIAIGGRRLRVVYGGRRNGGGPDFKDAVIATEDHRLLCGDVEIHRRSSDWRLHGHHRDPRYDSVILHGVLWDDGVIALRHDGTEVPLVVLGGWGDESVAATKSAGKGCGHAGKRLGPDEVGRLLDDAGDARFGAKAARFGEALGAQGPEQILYEDIMAALGYAHNQEPFRQVARRLPWSALSGRLAGRSGEEAQRVAQSLLLRAAGLLPLEGEATLLDSEAGWTSLPWQRLGLRPVNAPERRLRGAAALAVRYRQGLLSGLLTPFRGPPRQLPTLLCQALMVASPEGPALVGRQRAAEIGVNVVLPFYFAWGQAEGDAGLAAKAMAAYAAYPQVGQNAITKHMGHQLALGPEMMKSARRQQGLLHLYKAFCTHGRCSNCPLS